MLLSASGMKASKLPFDCHLMITEPQRYIDSFLDAGAIAREARPRPTLRATPASRAT